MQLQLSLSVADRLHETLLVRGEPLDAVEAARLLIASPEAPASLCREILSALVAHDRRFCWDSGPASQLSLCQWEAADPHLVDVPFVALDLETTGARAGTAKITEIGAVRIEGLREVGHFSTLVNPLRPIPPMITHLTGITQEMVAGAPHIEEVIPEFLQFLEGAVVIAHNAPFDVGFLNYELQRLKGRKLGEGAVDTLPLARALAPGLPNYRLHTVAEALGAPVTACHRALADAQAAAHVFVTLAGRLEEQGITRLGELRTYLSPSARLAMDKLHLTRDLPRSPGTYRFVDKDGRVLYVGKADRLAERVRSHFVADGQYTRKVRQAARLVERIDWDEACTPLEAVVYEHRLLLEHRPSHNLHGTRPETYAYIKVGGSRAGLGLSMSSRAPRWLDGGEQPARSSGPRSSDSQSPRAPLLMGPFRGRTRLHAALDLLQRCYPIRRCPQRVEGRPCARADRNRCLAPCSGDPAVQWEHDALVLQIVDWLAGRADTGLPDPLELADGVMKSLARQRHHEEARRVKEAREHLQSICRSYTLLAEARGLRFAALWPHMGNGDGPAIRLNLIWNGMLQDPVWLHPARLEEEIRAILDGAAQDERRVQPSGAAMFDGSQPPGAGAPGPGPGTAGASLVAVPQRDLDLLLAVRHWYYETDYALKVPLPGPEAGTDEWEQARICLANKARALLTPGPVPGERTGSAV
jgi:DNA polymerase-3 subunit epsilon